MAEYIEREKAIDAIANVIATGFVEDRYITPQELQDLLEELARLPAAYVAPVVHGRPVKKLRHRGGFVCRKGLDNIGEIRTIVCDERYTEESLYCPVCGKLMSGEFLHYCDNCGAKMDCE